MDFDYGKEIMRIRENYGKKKFEGTLPCPLWMEDDKLHENLYAEKQRIFSEGHICYGWLVQANENLFKVFPYRNYPATLVYSHDEIVNQNPLVLSNIAEEIFSYKETPLEEVPEIFRDVVACIQDEYDREAYSIKMNVNDSEVAINIATTMIYRKFIPSRKLVAPMMPVIALTENPAKVHVLPKKYWTKDFIKNMWS